MKYEGIRQAGEDKDSTSYLFSFRKQEIELLFSIVDKYHKYFPKTTETTIVRSRLSNIRKILLKLFESIQ